MKHLVFWGVWIVLSLITAGAMIAIIRATERAVRSLEMREWRRRQRNRRW